MTRIELFKNILRKKSFLCVGLDSDIKKIPAHLLKADDPIFEFNKSIIDATASFCVAYKPNLAFYESLGADGWVSLKRTVDYLRLNHPDQFIIADAKRGDIGNTSALYARTFFETYNFDALTVAPYMGEDSVMPFMDYPQKWVVLLALTSNNGAFDFQFQKGQNGQPLFESVLRTSQKWADADRMMYVVGATKAEMLSDIRRLVPDHFLLVPGVGAQGGSLHDVARLGMNKQCGLLVNSSRAIIYADNTIDFAAAASNEALKIQQEMMNLLELYL